MATLTREQIADVLHEQREGEMGCERKDPRNCLYWHEEVERADTVLPLLNESLAAREDQLRQLLSYCQEREVYKGRDNEIGADTAYGDVAEKLAAILDGES